MKFIPSTIAVIAICFVVTSAFGQTRGDKSGARKGQFDPEKVLHDKDANGDGKLSLEEWKTNRKDPAKAEAKFKVLDADKDGFVTLEELKAKGKGGKGGKKGAEKEPASETES